MISKLIGSAGFLSSGGSIGGDLTISGDLTVEGDSSGAYSEIITDGLQITKTIAASSGANAMLTLDGTELASADLAVGDGVRLLFKVPYAGETSKVGASIDAVKEEAADDNSRTSLIFSTSQDDETLDEAMRIDDNGSVGIGNTAPESIFHIMSADPVLIVQDLDTAYTGNASIQLGTGDSSYDFEHGHRLRHENLKFHIQETADNSSFTNLMVIDTNSRISLSNNDSGEQNTLFGKNAGLSLDANSDQNTFIGEAVSDASMSTAVANTGVGYNVLSELTGGDYNTGIGAHSLNALTSGEANIAVGVNSATDTTVGVQNVAIGNNSLQVAHATESGNIAIGHNAMSAVDEGENGHGSGTAEADYNVAVGFSALLGGDMGDASSSDGSNRNFDGNIAIGAYALDATSTHPHTGSIAIGHQALTAVSYGQYNTAIGYQSGYTLSTQESNTLVGYRSGYALTSTDCVMIGTYAGEKQDAAGSCVYIGSSAGRYWDASGNIAIGLEAMYGGGSAGAPSANTGTYNTAIGYNAMKGATAAATGSNNVAIGKDAGKVLQGAANSNTAIGTNVMKAASNAGFVDNVGIGMGALDDVADVALHDVVAVGNYSLSAAGLTAGANFSVAIGREALFALTTGSGNVAVGYQALDAATTDDYNTAIGYQALSGVTGTNDNYNTAVGYQAGLNVTTGIHNTLLGYGAADSMTVGDYNTAVGSVAMAQITTNDIQGCVAIGYKALLGETTTSAGANYTIAIGQSALENLTTGGGNVAIGYLAMDSLTTGNNNIAIGASAMGDTNNDDAFNSDYNIIIGHNAGSGDWQSKCVNNVAIGSSSMNGAMDDADNNTAVGHTALNALTTGDNNVAVGAYAGENITTGHSNTLIGYSTGMVVGGGYGLTTSGYNTAVGFEALGASSANAITVDGYNTCIGFRSGYELQNSGSFNTLVGYNSGIDMTTGDSNVAIGVNALANTTSGEANIGIGRNTGDLITTGNSNTLIGHEADTDANSDNYQVKIGHYGVKKWKTARVTINDYTPSDWTDNDAATTALFSVPIYSHVSKVWCRIIQKSDGTAIYNISMGTASDEAVGEVIAGRVELLGADAGTGCVTRSQATQNANSNIAASTGDTEGMVWVSNINVETTNSDGWCDAAMYFYVACSGTGNATSDPGDDVILDIGVEYY